MKYANLHLHSTYSDAGFTPRQLVLIGKALGYKALALTDHETDGGNKSFMRACRQEGIDSMTGVEFYGRVEGYNVHLTALDFDPDEPAIRAFIKERCDKQEEITRKIVEFGISEGIIEDLTWQDVLDNTPEGSWLCIDSVTNSFRAKRVPIPANFRQRVFKSEYALSLKGPHPDAERVIGAVREAGGVIALAHPGVKMPLYIEKLVEMGLNGIETGHPDIRPEIQPLAEEAAKKYNLYNCGGTDHSGPMSCCGGEYAYPTFEGITEEQYYTLKERKLG